jgi:8-hydroxy-5-deazaflavin:NADPH oxidoreductase
MDSPKFALKSLSKVATANPSQVRRAASPHLPLSLDDDASPHIGMYLAVVGLLARTLEGVYITEALDNVQGIEGKTVIDATNLVGVEPPEGFSSNAEYVKSRTNAPTAKSFNANFASLYARLGEAGSTPSSLWSGDEEARQVVEQLTRDAGYEPVYAGPLENAAAQESFIKLILGIAQGGLGPFLYRMAPPDQL